MAMRSDGRMERPIIFSGEMVRAILDGRKTQTRRVVKPQPGDDERDDGYDSTILSRCPYGKPGDLLWVRETWKVSAESNQPRWASRILLEVVSVRVERVQEISLEDACAEGIYQKNPTWEDISPPDPREDFEKLWDSINGKKPGRSWADNPWVWVVEFKRMDGP